MVTEAQHKRKSIGLEAAAKVRGMWKLIPKFCRSLFVLLETILLLSSFFSLEFNFSMWFWDLNFLSVDFNLMKTIQFILNEFWKCRWMYDVKTVIFTDLHFTVLNQSNQVWILLHPLLLVNFRFLLVVFMSSESIIWQKIKSYNIKCKNKKTRKMITKRSLDFNKWIVKT